MEQGSCGCARPRLELTKAGVGVGGVRWVSKMHAQKINKGGASGLRCQETGEVGVLHQVGAALVAGVLSPFPPFPSLYPRSVIISLIFHP